MTLEVFTDYVCPWCYLGDARVRKLKKNFDLNIKLVHFPLHPETPLEGRTLLELFRTSTDDIKEKNLRIMLSLRGIHLSPESLAIKKIL